MSYAEKRKLQEEEKPPYVTVKRVKPDGTILYIPTRAQGVSTPAQRVATPAQSTQRVPMPAQRPDTCPLDTCPQVTQHIQRFYESTQQSPDRYQSKFKLRDALFAIVKDVFPYCGLYIVGSSLNGFGSSMSDMDLCLMVSHVEIDQKTDAIELLFTLLQAFRQCGFLKKVRLIKAKVPILKFVDSFSGIECDLNINNSVGIRNTHLLSAYSQLDSRVRPLVMFVKHWAKFQNINDASQQTLSSYSLVLMVIHYLQCGCRPPALPSLQEMYPMKFNVGIDVRTLRLSEKLPAYTSVNKQSIGELFCGFLQYYARDFRFDVYAISVRLGKAVAQTVVKTFDRNRYPLAQWKHLCIEEPFDRSNTASAVFDPFTFQRILRVFRRSHEELSRTRDVNVILSTVM